MVEVEEETMALPREHVTKRVPAEAEIEVPATLLDLLDSFVSSSEKEGYYFNQSPYVKVLSPTKYWRVYKENGKVCLELDATKWSGLICLIKEAIDALSTLEVLIRAPNAISMRMNLVHAIVTTFVSRYRQHKVRAINIYRKLAFYDELIKE